MSGEWAEGDIDGLVDGIEPTEPLPPVDGGDLGEVQASAPAPEHVAVEVQKGTAGTVVCFDFATAKAFAAAAPDWRVVSSSSPQAAISPEGGLVTSWLALFQAQPTGPWVLVPPADPWFDRDTWNLCSIWKEEAELAGISDIRLRVVPGGSPEQWARTRPESVRPFLESAKVIKLRGRPPAARKAPSSSSRPSGAPVLDVGKAQVLYPSTVDELGQERPGKVLMSGACPIVKAVETTVDDLVEGRPVHNQFRLALILPDGTEVPVSVPVSVEELPRIGKWLGRAESGQACTIWVDPEFPTGARIAAALQRAAAETPERVAVRPRTGWIELDGRAYYLTSTGCIGADGIVQCCRADVDYRLDYSKGLDGDPIEAWRKAMEVAGRLGNPTPFLAIIAFGAGVVAGVPPQGSLALVGDAQAGKTSVLRAALAIFGGINSAWAGTEKSRGELLVGCHQAVGLVDDVPPKPDRKAQLDQVNALGLLLRRGYDQEVAYGRLMPSATAPSGVRRAPTDKSWPGVCISLEEVPDQLEHSARERMLVWATTKSDTWRPGTWDKTKEDWLGTSLPVVAGASFLMALSGAIDDFGGLEKWLKHARSWWMLPYEAERYIFGGKKSAPQCSPRMQDKLLPYWNGFRVLNMVWELIGVPDNERREWVVFLKGALMRWTEGVQLADEKGTAGAKVIDSLASAIASGRAVICADDAVLPPGVVRVGKRLPDGDVGVFPKALAPLIGSSADLVRSALCQAGGSKRTIYLAGVRLWGVAIPPDKWPQGDDTTEPAPTEDF